MQNMLKPKGTPLVMSLVAGAMFACLAVLTAAQPSRPVTTLLAQTSAQIPQETMIHIVRAEDERRWDNELRQLLVDPDEKVRRRAALAAGRIGDEGAVPVLIERLQTENLENVKEMVAFALGEIESPAGMRALIAILGDTQQSRLVRARAVEALGKIAASLPAAADKQKSELNAAILNALKFEAQRRSLPDEQTIRLALTAAIRAKLTDAGTVISEFLGFSSAAVRADAANTIARLRLKDGTGTLRQLVTTDADAVVRANAARALGAAEDKQSFDVLLDRALNDSDLRVRVSAIRALAPLKDVRLTQPLLTRAAALMKNDLRNRPSEANELLEIAVTLGRVLQGTESQEALGWLRTIRPGFGFSAPELEIAFARISPRAYLHDLGSDLPPEKRAQKLLPVQWKTAAALAQGLAEIAAAPATINDRTLVVAQAESLLRLMLDYRNSNLKNKTLLAVHSEYAIPDMLRALAAFKPKDLAQVLRSELNADDVIIRATAADLLGDLEPDEANALALSRSLPVALKDRLNDAALSILDSLAKQKTSAANETIKVALDSPDHLVRRRAVTLLKANGAGDFAARIGTVKSTNTTIDYKRALDRAGKTTTARIVTSKGPFVIEFLSSEAPLTVDNFVRLANEGYFNGQIIPRVVPNFVMQAGDPRGDQNGGPGYTIRCEINEIPYERAAVGMALSGKDTGGSQWFVTHSPQPHLDGGYTVFGRVISGMEVVDALVRGDILRSVTIIERSPTKPPKVETAQKRFSDRNDATFATSRPGFCCMPCCAQRCNRDSR